MPAPDPQPESQLHRPAAPGVILAPLRQPAKDHHRPGEDGGEQEHATQQRPRHLRLEEGPRRGAGRRDERRQGESACQVGEAVANGLRRGRRRRRCVPIPGTSRCRHGTGDRQHRAGRRRDGHRALPRGRRRSTRQRRRRRDARFATPDGEHLLHRLRQFPDAREPPGRVFLGARPITPRYADGSGVRSGESRKCFMSTSIGVSPSKGRCPQIISKRMMPHA